MTEAPAAETSSKPKAKTVIATWKIGNTGMRRVVTKAEAKKALSVTLEEDLVWEASNHWRQDVTGVPEAMLANLNDDPDFKVSEET